MVTVLWLKSQQCLNPFTMWAVKGFFETGLFGKDLTTFFGVRNIGNILTMEVIFFL